MVDIWFFYIQYNGFTICIFSYLNPFSVCFDAIQLILLIIQRELVFIPHLNIGDSFPLGAVESIVLIIIVLRPWVLVEARDVLALIEIIVSFLKVGVSIVRHINFRI